MLHLPWPRHLVVLGVLGAGLTLLVGATAIFTLAGTVTTAGEMGQLTRAQRLHQDADMMHDALRTDVGEARQALRPSPSSVPAAILLEETKTHAQRFRDDVDALQAMDLPPDVANAVTALEPAQEGYIATAQRLVRSMLSTGRVDGEELEQFQNMFESLVTTQAAATVVPYRPAPVEGGHAPRPARPV